MKWCVANGRIIDPSQNIDRIGDLWIEDDTIIGVDFQKAFTQDCDQAIDARGCFVAPGFIDLHVHLRDPGATYKEDIESGCRAAARGGFTTICCMPNTQPVIDNEDILAYVDEKARRCQSVNVLVVGAISQGQLGVELASISEMMDCETRCREMTEKGICALSEDGKSLSDDQLYLKAMKVARDSNIPIFSHAEGGYCPNSDQGELEGVLRDLELLKEEPCRLHFCHISAKKSLAAIENARRQGIDVTCETAPHYFSLTKTDREDDGNYKMNPPLRTAKDRDAIREGLRNGAIQAIATDHAPHSPEEKEGGYASALNGIIGLETAFPVSYTQLVEGGFLSLSELVGKLSTGPAKILGIDRGTLKPGSCADITIFKVSENYQIDREKFQSKSRNTPFNKMSVSGRLLMTLVNGQVIYSNETLPIGKEKK
jgi:dihydroorotase